MTMCALDAPVRQRLLAKGGNVYASRVCDVVGLDALYSVPRAIVVFAFSLFSFIKHDFA